MFFMVTSERSDVEMVKWFRCIRCRVTSVLVEYNLTFTDVLLQILAKPSVFFSVQIIHYPAANVNLLAKRTPAANVNLLVVKGHISTRAYWWHKKRASTDWAVVGMYVWRSMPGGRLPHDLYRLRVGFGSCYSWLRRFLSNSISIFQLTNNRFFFF